LSAAQRSTPAEGPGLKQRMGKGVKGLDRAGGCRVDRCVACHCRSFSAAGLGRRTQSPLARSLAANSRGVFQRH
jgi:hypothetical protein